MHAATCPMRSTSARTPTTGWWAPTPAITPTCGVQCSAWACRRTGAASGCSMPDAAPERRRPHCWQRLPKPKSSPSTHRAACWRRRGPNPGRRRSGSSTPPSKNSASTASPGRSTAFWRPICCAIWPTRTANCAPSPNSCGRAERSRCTSTPCGIPVPPLGFGTRSAGGSSFPPGGARTRSTTLYRHLWRSVLTLRRGGAVPAADVRCRIHHSPQRNHARLGTQHRPYFYRKGAAVTDAGPTAVAKDIRHRPD